MNDIEQTQIHRPTEQGTISKRPSLAILILVTALGPLAINILLPSLPGLQHEFNTEYSTVQLVITLYLAALAIAQLVYGPLSDRFGRRPAMVVGLAIFMIGNLVSLFAPTIEILIAGRVLQAVGGCAGVVLSRAMIRDMYDQNKAASMMAYVTMAMVVAPMFAPAIGGYLETVWGWRASFVFVSSIGALVFIASLLALHETHHVTKGEISHDSTSGLLNLLSIPAFYGYVAQLGFTSAIFFSFIGGAPYVMEVVMKQTPQTFGLYFILVSVMYMTGNFTAARLSVRLGTDRMIHMGATVALVGAMFLTTVYLNEWLSPLTLFGSMAFVAMGNGMAIPNGVAGAISVNPRLAGTASGVSGFLQMSVGAGASYLVGVWLSKTYETALPLIVMMVGAAVLAYLAYWIGIRPISRSG